MCHDYLYLVYKHLKSQGTSGRPKVLIMCGPPDDRQSSVGPAAPKAKNIKKKIPEEHESGRHGAVLYTDARKLYKKRECVQANIHPRCMKSDQFGGTCDHMETLTAILHPHH